MAEIGPLLFESVRNVVRRRVHMMPVDDIRIEPSQLGKRAGVLGAMALAAVAIFPFFVTEQFNVTASYSRFFGGTGLLIIVGVALDTLQQLESQLMTRHYEGFMKKGRIHGRR